MTRKFKKKWSTILQHCSFYQVKNCSCSRIKSYIQSGLPTHEKTMENTKYFELLRLLPNKSEIKKCTVSWPDSHHWRNGGGWEEGICGWQSSNLVRPLLRFCGSFTAPSRPLAALFLSRSLRFFNGPFWAKGPWQRPLGNPGVSVSPLNVGSSFPLLPTPSPIVRTPLWSV